MSGLLAFDADEHLASVAPLAIQRGVRIFLPYYKLFTPADRDAIWKAASEAGVSVGIIPIFETTAERGLAGSSAGVQDGQSIARYMAASGQPSGTSYVLTFDFDEQAAQDPACRAYAGAVQAANPSNLMVAYGNGALAEELKQLGIAKFAWDAGGMGMRGTRADLASGQEDLQQDVGDVRGLHLGIEIDSDFAPHATKPEDLGAWTSPASGAEPSPEPASAQVPTPTSVQPVAIPSALQLQQALQAEGRDIGPTGADGKWGPRSGAALQEHFDEQAS